MNIIYKGYNFILLALATGAGIVIFSSFAMIVIDVSIRIVGLKPPLFTMAVVEYGLLWFTMLAAPWLVRIKGHVFIDAVTQFLPPNVKKVVAKIVYSICIVSSTIYCIHTYQLFQNAWVRELLDLRSIEMPEWLIYLPMPVCFFLVAIEFARFLIGIDDMYDKNIEEREGV